jgi:hypothetical protein
VRYIHFHKVSGGCNFCLHCLEYGLTNGYIGLQTSKYLVLPRQILICVSLKWSFGYGAREQVYGIYIDVDGVLTDGIVFNFRPSTLCRYRYLIRIICKFRRDATETVFRYNGSFWSLKCAQRNSFLCPSKIMAMSVFKLRNIPELPWWSWSMSVKTGTWAELCRQISDPLRNWRSSIYKLTKSFVDKILIYVRDRLVVYKSSHDQNLHEEAGDISKSTTLLDSVL